MNGIMETVCLICVAAKKETKDGTTFQKLLTCVRRQFRKNNIELKLLTVRDKSLQEEVFYVNGYYDPEADKHHECPIEIVITHNFKKDEVWYPKHAGELLTQIFDSTVHELRHMRQFRKRKFKQWHHDTSHASYLADPDEIDAYSISIAFELCRSLGKHRALKYLKNIPTLGRYKLNGQFVSPSLSMYLDYFPNTNSKVIHKLSTKVYVRLMKVDTDFIFM